MLKRVQAEGLRTKLVGFETVDPSIVPDEGCQVVVAGRPVGRVSSSRLSPTLRKSIGMAWVPIDRASPGSLFEIRLEGRDVPARVVALPFYDPDGARMRGGDWSPSAAARQTGPSTAPPKLSAFHHRLIAAGATIVDFDGWRQAERVGDIEGEVRRAREGVGVFDVSPASKLSLKGTAVSKVLDQLCGDDAPQLLKVAQALVGETSVALARLAEDEALALAPPGALEDVSAAISGAIEREGGCAHLVDVTSTFAGLRLVGQRCRELLRTLTSADLRDRTLPNDGCAQVGLANVPAIVVRRDVVGLPGYELYVTRDYAEYVWDAVFDAGRGLGIAPIGLLAWRAVSGEG